MSEALTLLLAWMAGLILGAIFFGGLWWTVRKGLTSRQPALWFLASMLLRATIVLTGFYLVTNGHLERLILCLLGFVMARLIVTQMTRAPAVAQIRPTPENSHAS